jgi:putative glutamine amidotransferase
MLAHSSRSRNRVSTLSSYSITKPHILVLPDLQEESSGQVYKIRVNYLQALSDAGGIPWVMPYGLKDLDAYMEGCHGLMIIGGGHTIDPHFLGEVENLSSLPVNPPRTKMELALFHRAYALNLPILGICGGAQLINVALGGGLLHGVRGHTHSHPTTSAHPIEIIAGTQLSKIFQKTLTAVNSSHVQAIGPLGHRVCVNATAPDGIIEGIESTEHPFCLGVQWHPEYASEPDGDPLLFQAFIDQARFRADAI